MLLTKEQGKAVGSLLIQLTVAQDGVESAMRRKNNRDAEYCMNEYDTAIDRLALLGVNPVPAKYNHKGRTS